MCHAMHFTITPLIPKMTVSITFQSAVKSLLLVMLASPAISFFVGSGIGRNMYQPHNDLAIRMKTALSESENDQDKGDLFLSQMAANLNDGSPDLLQPSSLPQDTPSKMRQWAGEYNREAMRARLQNRIDNYPIFMLMFDTCPYCKTVLATLKEKGIDPKAAKIVELDSLGVEKYAIRSEVIEMVGQTSIPALWIKGQFIGGSEELLQLEESGELDALLKKANALVVSES